MRAAVLERFGEPLIEVDVEPAGIAPDEVLVRVVASGICHSDRTVHLGAQDRPLPLVLGHESSGVVEQVGSAVTMFAPGDHVVGSPSACCGRCGYCLRGLTQHCLDKGQTRTGGGPRLVRGGTEVHAFIGLGGFADHMLVSERGLVRIPDEMPLESAALLGCAVLTGVGAVRHRADVRAGQTVAVIGCGGVGLNAIQAARLVGATQIIAVDRNDFRVDIPLYCQMYLRGQLKLDELISEVIDLSEVTRRLEHLDSSDGARSVIRFRDGRG